MLWKEEAERFGADIQRVQVWDALSRFYLDTELDAKELEHICEILARSPFSLEELRYIELIEVEPVCGPNLLCIAGEWGLFSPDWLIPRCLGRQRRYPYSEKRLERLWYRFKNAIVASNINLRRVEQLRAKDPAGEL